MANSRNNGKVQIAESPPTTKNLAIDRAIRTPDAFDEAEAVRQNQEFYAKQCSQKEGRRAAHNAICEIQGKPPAYQREWLRQQEDPFLQHSVFKYLDPVVQVELINAAESAALNRYEEEKRKGKTRLSKIRKAEAFLLDALPRGQPVPAETILQKAADADISTRTLYRVKTKLRIRSQRAGFGPAGHFLWLLPAEDH